MGKNGTEAEKQWEIEAKVIAPAIMDHDEVGGPGFRIWIQPRTDRRRQKRIISVFSLSLVESGKDLAVKTASGSCRSGDAYGGLRGTTYVGPKVAGRVHLFFFFFLPSERGLDIAIA